MLLHSHTLHRHVMDTVFNDVFTNRPIELERCRYKYTNFGNDQNCVQGCPCREPIEEVQTAGGYQTSQ
jgi:hypothetical protein